MHGITTQDTTGDKGQVLFVPGLQGEFQIARSSGPDGTNQDVVRQVAQDVQWNFDVADYQTSSDPYPTMNEMQKRVAERFISHMDLYKKDKPLVIVASSVGAGVAIGALTQIMERRPRVETSPYALLLYKPVIDPVAVINEMYKGQGLEKLGEFGERTHFLLPIQSDSPGHFFKLEARHFRDKDAVRLLSCAEDFAAFSRKVDPVLTHIVACHNDPLTPSAPIQAFTAAIRYRRVEQQWVDGNHATDATDALQANLRKVLAGMAYMR